MSGAIERLEPDAAHAAQMNAIYGLQRHVYDLTRKYYLLGRDRAIRDLDVRPGHHVLEVGCGTARNLAEAAWRYPGAQFYGIDISDEMLKSARAKLARKRLATRVRVARGDAAAFDPQRLFRRGQFDRILFSYTLSMIPGWESAIDLGCALLAPGGEIHMVDFGRQERLPRWFGPAFRVYLAQFHVTPRAELFEACEDLAARHALACETRQLFRDYARSAVLRRR